jgi:hypothetical protein
MRGLGRMIIAGTTFIVTLACQGCVQTGTSNALPPAGPNAYTATHMLDQTDTPKLTSDYSGVFSRTEFAARPAFKGPDSYSAPINLEAERGLSSKRLYSSQTLTSFASDREQASLSPVPQDNRRLTAELSLSAPSEQTGFGFDLGFAPRVTITREGEIETQRFGGEVRIGQNFDKRGAAHGTTSWYLFAGADGEALVWEPGETGQMSVNDMALRDKVTVGDMQAGVSINRAGGQLSLSYIRREVEYRERNLGASENEDFAGVSFTIKR